MAFVKRPSGWTLQRDRDALLNPHSGKERFDPDFPTAMRCQACGKHAYGPRRFMREAMQEHLRSDCPVRHTTADEVKEFRIFYPRT